MKGTLQKQSNQRTWLWLILILGLFVVVGYFLSSNKPKEYTPYVTESPSPTGVKAIYTYLDKERQVKVSNSLPGETRENEMLIMIEPYFTPGSSEMESYYRFMEAGNRILLLKDNPGDMFDVSTEFIENAPEEPIVHDENGTTYEADVFSSVRLEAEESDSILLQDDAGVVALERSFGDGALIVALTPYWMTNELILEADHLPLVLSFLNKSEANTFMFDEYIHGEKSFTAQLNYYPMWFILLMLQLGILAILWLWHNGKRFGMTYVPLREDTVRFSDEGLQALAAWYMRGRRYQDSLKIQAAYLKQVLQEKWRIPYREDWLDLGDYLAQRRLMMSQADIQDFLQGLTAVLAKEAVNKQEYVYWSKKIDQFRKEVEED